MGKTAERKPSTVLSTVMATVLFSSATGYFIGRGTQSAIAAAIVAGPVGYFIGQGLTIGVFGSSPAHDSRELSEKDALAIEDSDDEAQEGLKAFEEHSGECKMTLVVRTDLGMGRGKIAAQCGHATLANYRTLLMSKEGRKVLRRWERLGQAKVALQVASEDELELLQAQAMSLGMAAQIIHDAGRTQVASGSATVLAVGPAPKAVVDQVTGGLKLL